MILAVISGYFNPIHPGHISLIQDVKNRWPDSTLIAIVNNDNQVQIKGSTPFLDEETRRIIVENIKGVDEAYISIDKSSSVVETLSAIRNDADPNVDIIFCNGGDRKDEVPESSFCKNNNIRLEYGFGDEKTYASSSLLENVANWINDKAFWREFFDDIMTELDIDPSKLDTDKSP